MKQKILNKKIFNFLQALKELVLVFYDFLEILIIKIIGDGTVPYQSVFFLLD